MIERLINEIMVFAQRSATSCVPVGSDLGLLNWNTVLSEACQKTHFESGSDLGVKNQNPVLSKTFRKVSEMCFGFGLESFHLCLMLVLAHFAVFAQLTTSIFFCLFVHFEDTPSESEWLGGSPRGHEDGVAALSKTRGRCSAIASSAATKAWRRSPPSNSHRPVCSACCGRWAMLRDSTWRVVPCFEQ